MTRQNQKKVGSAVQPCPCGLDKFVVACEHNGRSAGSENLLEIVATPRASEEENYIFGPEEVASITVQIKHDHGGDDAVKATLTTSGAGCKEKISFEGAGLDVPEWKQGKERIEKLKVETLYQAQKGVCLLSLSRVSPSKYTVKGKTSRQQKSITVYQYPSDQISYGVKVDGLSYIAKNLNDSMEKWGENFFGWSPAKLVPKIVTPAGSLKGSYGWKEDQDWRVFYEILCEAGLDPLIGFELKVEVSLLACAGASVGIPPVVTKFAGKHLADILVGCGVGIGGKIVGNISKQKYTNSQTKYKGKLALAIEGSFSVGLTARVGSDYILSVAASGEGKVTIANDNEVLFVAEKISFQPSLKLKPIELKVTVKTRAFYVFSKNKSTAWNLWKEDVDIWKGREKVLLDISKLKKSFS